MYTGILNKEKISFKTIEQTIFADVCEAGRKMTVLLLEKLDKKIAEQRDKKKYRDKGLRKTTIKTIYGEVEYRRHAYITKDENGKSITVYLLDEELDMNTFGLISTNLAEKIIETATNAPFRKTAQQTTQMTGQRISHGGVWNLIQAMGESIEKEEKQMVEEFKTEQPLGQKEIPVLFEEMDGVYLKSQGKGGRKEAGMEVKVGTIYEGWKESTGKRSILSGKTVLAGIESSEQFLEKWEAKIQSIYDPEKIGMRILNGDGGNWIHDEYDVDAIQQLDRFHVVKMIRKNTSHESMRKDMLSKLRENKIEELVELGQIYYDSVVTKEGDAKEEELAEELKEYLKIHKEELASYKKRGKEIPDPPKGIVYKNMGIQENQNCTLITLRMKGKRKRWSSSGANNMIRLLYYRENKELYDAIERHTDGEMWIEPVKRELGKVISAAKAPKTDGKGNNRDAEILSAHLPILDSANSRTAQMFRRLCW